MARDTIPISSGGDIGVISHYVWRGFVLADRVSMQPTYWVKVGDVTASSWMNLAGEQVNGPLTEHDLTVDYSKSFGTYTVSGGWINYIFPGADDDVSNEIYGGLAVATLLNPFVKVYQDVHAGTGTYVSFGVSQPFALTKGITATPTLSLGYNHHQWTDLSTWSDAQIGVKAAVATWSEKITLTPSLFYSKSLNNDLVPNQWYGGIGLSTRF